MSNPDRRFDPTTIQELMERSRGSFMTDIQNGEELRKLASIHLPPDSLEDQEHIDDESTIETEAETTDTGTESGSPETL